VELKQLLKRELKLIYNNSFAVFNALVFFVIVAFSFSFAASGNISLQIATSIIIVCFMLASNLSSGFIFNDDIESGILQQLFIRVGSLNNLVLAKILSQYICFGIPLSFAVPVVSIFFNISFEHIITLMVMVLLTSFLLSVLNVMISGVTAGIKAGSIISVILSIPLYIPIIILNLSFIEARAGGEGSLSSFAANIFAFALIIIPLALFSIRHTIRNAVES
jgi:heme exporter protein B